MKSKKTKIWLAAFLAPTLILFLGFYAYSILTVGITGFTAVSYTHLDVYKRQRINSLLRNTKDVAE